MDEQNTTPPPPVTPPAPGTAPHAMQQNTVMAVLSYVSILVLVPLLTAKDDPFVAYHARQGLVLLIIEVAVWAIAHFMLFMLWPLWQLVNLGCFVLAIIGIMHAVQGKQEPLPLVGSFAGQIKF